ncbi:hypothetical protein Avbf_16869 [Armadillidium vulgare]|nr:hypothetical protein Avbf_16869 [Armadillidium vulgare]
MSDAKRKPSGSEFKKRRLSKQTQPQKQSDALQNFLKEGSFNAPTTDQHLKRPALLSWLKIVKTKRRKTYYTNSIDDMVFKEQIDDWTLNRRNYDRSL